MICKRCGCKFDSRKHLLRNSSMQCPECKTIYRKKNSGQQQFVQGGASKNLRSHRRKSNTKTHRCKSVIVASLCFFSIALLTAIGLDHSNAEHINHASSITENSTSQIQHVSRMKLYFTIDGKDITAYYTGALVDNQPFGEGIYEFEDTHGPWSFVGSLENGIFSNGIMTDYPYTMSFEDDQCYSKYSGPFSNSQPSGEGIYTIVTHGNTAVLEGNYDPQNGFSGYASQLSMSFVYNGVSFAGIYTGEYLNGQPNGNGNFKSEGELFFYYDGTWNQGSIVGPGQLHTNNAQMNVNGSLARAEYSGHIENAFFNGEGTISIKQGDTHYTYSGNWSNNIYSGEGTLSVSSADSIGYTYNGSWKDGVYSGEGSLIYDSDDIIKYIGNFENGEFRPTFLQLINCLCSAENSKVILADDTLEYIENFQMAFLEHTTTVPTFDFSYEDYATLQSEENSLCFTASLKIIQAREYDANVFGYPLTEFIGSDDEERVYYGYYMGYFDEIKSGDMTRITAYPIGYAPYKSQEGKEIPSLRFLAFDVQKDTK